MDNSEKPNNISSIKNIDAKTAIVLGNTYTATSFYWQWKYLSALSEQQLLYSKNIYKMLKSIKKHQKANSGCFRFFRSRKVIDSDSEDSDVELDATTQESAKQNIPPTNINEVENNSSSNQEQTFPTNQSASVQETPISETRNSDFPLGFYIKIFAFLIITKAPRLFLYIYIFVATCHFLGFFNASIAKLRQFCTEMGFDRTKPLPAILRQLKRQQQMEAQQAQSESLATQILKNLQQMMSQPNLLEQRVLGKPVKNTNEISEMIINGVIYTKGTSIYTRNYISGYKPLHCDDVLIEDELTSLENKAETEVVYSKLLVKSHEPDVRSNLKNDQNQQIQKRLKKMRFIYQLFIALIASLNPRWEPICVLIFDENHHDVDN